MTKGHTRQFVKKQVDARPEVRVRELPPKFDTTNKDAKILCPFCEVPHEVRLGGDAPCGTTLKITAVQTIVLARTVRKHEIVCVKCHKSGGEMVRAGGAFVHLVDCVPGTRIVAVPPRFSQAARIVHRLPWWIRTRVEARTGFSKPVSEVDPEGKETGKTLGYFFYKPQSDGQPLRAES